MRRSQLDILNSGSALTAPLVPVAIDWRTGMATDFSDVWFADPESGLVVPHYLDAHVTSTKAWFYLRPQGLPVGTKRLNVLWDDTDLAVPGDGHAVFDFFDPVDRNWSLWTQSGSNPILTAGAGTYRAWGTVWWDAGTYYLFYTQEDYSIWVATSTDGITFSGDTKVLDHSEAWEGTAVWDPCVWKEGSTWYMIYTGNTGTNKVGLATSASPTSGWSKYASNPVLDVGGGGAWDATGVENFGVIKVGSTYYMWYNTLSGVSNRRTGLATSTDLHTWTKDAANPIFGYDTYQAFPFKHGDWYYLLINHTRYSSNGCVIALYRDTAPTFYEGDREIVRIVAATVKGAWNNLDHDTPCVVTDTIARDTFVADGRIRMYCAASPAAGEWDTGLYFADAECDLEPVKAGTDFGNSGQTGYYEDHCDAAVYHEGAKSYSITGASQTYTTNERMAAIAADCVVEAWFRVDAATAGQAYLYFYEAYSTLKAAIGVNAATGVWRYYGSGGTVDTTVAYAEETWYLLRFAWDQSAKTFTFTVLTEDMREVLRVADVATSVSAHIDRLSWTTGGTFNGTIWFDAWRIREPGAAVRCRFDRTVHADGSPAQGWWQKQQTLPDVLYVEGTLGADTNDGRRWDRAKKTIAGAVAVATAGTRIEVGPGAYSEATDLSAATYLTIYLHRGAIVTSSGSTLQLGTGCKVTGEGQVVSTAAGASDAAILALAETDIVICGAEGGLLRVTAEDAQAVALAECSRVRVAGLLAEGSWYAISLANITQQTDILIEDCIARVSGWTATSNMGIWCKLIDGLTIRNCVARAHRADNVDGEPIGIWVEECTNALLIESTAEAVCPGGYGQAIEAHDADLLVIGSQAVSPTHASAHDLKQSGTGTVSVRASAYDPDKTDGTLVDLDQRTMDATADLADGVETGVTVRQWRRAVGAIVAGLLSGAGTGAETFKGLDGLTTRVQVTADASGNRSNVVLTL